jgi:hypothetical protein
MAATRSVRNRWWTAPWRALPLFIVVVLAAAFLHHDPLGPRQAAAQVGVERPAPASGATDLGPDRLPQLQQRLSQLGALRWQQQGFRGQGIKVAILDSGFRNYKSFLGKVLPQVLTVKSFRKDGDLEGKPSQHGILCAEVIHSLAPAAELLLANWEPNDAQAFLQAVNWARQQGAHIISCSVIMPSWSDGEGGGEVNQAIARIVGEGRLAGDVLFFASAGNTAERHWCGCFCPDARGEHQWKDGQAANLLTPWGLDRVAVELYGPDVVDFDVQVCDIQTGERVEESPLTPGELANGCCRTVRFLPLPQHRYSIRLQCKAERSSARREPFHLVVLGGNLSCTTSRGSIACPADGPAVLAVGAVDGTGQRCSYSSCGPNSALPKPDFVAAVPFPSAWREQPFTGTSAAAPQAAGIAAVVWSRHPGWTAGQVRQALRRAALDLGPPGHDCDTGYGLIRLP